MPVSSETPSSKVNSQGGRAGSSDNGSKICPVSRHRILGLNSLPLFGGSDLRNRTWSSSDVLSTGLFTKALFFVSFSERMTPSYLLDEPLLLCKSHTAPIDPF